MFTDGDITPLFTEPLSVGMLVFALALLVWSLWAERRQRPAPA